MCWYCIHHISRSVDFPLKKMRSLWWWVCKHENGNCCSVSFFYLDLLIFGPSNLMFIATHLGWSSLHTSIVILSNRFFKSCLLMNVHFCSSSVDSNKMCFLMIKWNDWTIWRWVSRVAEKMQKCQCCVSKNNNEIPKIILRLSVISNDVHVYF